MFIAKDNGYILTEADLRFLIETKSILNEGIVDWLQSGLDVVGLIPGVGEVADGINAVISVARGNYLDMVFSIISMIPAAGDVFGKAGKYLTRALHPLSLTGFFFGAFFCFFGFFSGCTFIASF